jgi:hypothetical protein
LLSGKRSPAPLLLLQYCTAAAAATVSEGKILSLSLFPSPESEASLRSEREGFLVSRGRKGKAESYGVQNFTGKAWALTLSLFIEERDGSASAMQGVKERGERAWAQGRSRKGERELG